MAFAGSVLKRAPLSAAMFYLAAGYAVGPAGAGMLDLRLPAGAAAVVRVAEVAVLISLFTAGLKLRVPLADRRWLLPLRLAAQPSQCVSGPALHSTCAIIAHLL